MIATDGSFAGKVVLVTGASRGVGNATALAFAREGADLVITARGSATGLAGTLEETAAEIRALGRSVLVVPADMRDEGQVRALAERSLAEYGRIDVLVNNAGISAPAPFLETPLKRFDLIMQVNLRGPVVLLQSVLPSMVERGGGRVVHVSSYLPVTQTVPGQSIYSMSKLALENLSDWIARELAGHAVASNVLCIDRNITTDGWRLHNPDTDYAGHGWSGRRWPLTRSSGSPARTPRRIPGVTSPSPRRLPGWGARASVRAGRLVPSGGGNGANWMTITLTVHEDNDHDHGHTPGADRASRQCADDYAEPAGATERSGPGDGGRALRRAGGGARQR